MEILGIVLLVAGIGFFIWRSKHRRIGNFTVTGKIPDAEPRR